MELGKKQVVVFNYLTKMGFEKVRRDKVGQFTLVKVTIHHDNVTILNMHASNTGAPSYILYCLMKRYRLPTQ